MIETASVDDLNRITMPDTGFVNTEEFRREALHFMRHGYYCPDPWGSVGWKAYWREQTNRCENGYSVGGVRITGDHYSYLNFAQIKLTEDPRKMVKSENVVKNKVIRKKVTFPDFWDGDYAFFHAKELAELKGKHLMVAKSRRKGYSYKNGNIAANRYNLSRNSVTVIGAYLKDYLYPDGTMTMAKNYLDFFNQHTGWAKRRLIDKMDHVKSGFEEIDSRGIAVQKGYKSQIYAVTFNSNPGAARGKDGTLILLEEAGKFPNLKETFMTTRPTVEDGIYTTGLIIVFGTGGGDDSNWADFEDMFYDPNTFNLLPFDNIWDEGAQGTTCSFFVPDYMNKPGFVDLQGNSIKSAAKASEEAKREQIARSAKDPKTLDQHVAEYPFNPKEAFLRIGSNIFPVKLLQDHHNLITTKGVFKNMAVNGYMGYDDRNKIVHKLDSNARPLIEFPYRASAGTDPSGCVSIYQFPYRDTNGNVPPNLYFICHDPYANDTPYAAGSSFGATYVIKNTNNFSQPADMIVASYIGRPQFLDDYNRNLFMLAEYYNAIIGFENDRGSVIDYAKRHRKLEWLAPEFELAYDDKLKKPHMSRTFGMTMGSGKENLKRKQGEMYLKDWLLTPRGKRTDGTTLLNLHTINDPGLLLELIKYDPMNVTSFDRVSAMIVGMYYMKEIQYDESLQPKKSLNNALERLAKGSMNIS